VRVGARGFLGFVEVASRDPNVCAEAVEERELLAARPRWDEDDGLRPEPTARPGDRRSVIPRRRRDDDVIAPARELGDDRERAAPFEDAELVDVLPFQPEVAATDVDGESFRCTVERTGCVRRQAQNSVTVPSKISAVRSWYSTSTP
jgi:hypothetical protein